jgi:phosphomevalonate kinase
MTLRTFAPGKLVVAGAYAVLEGARAIVVAVDRGAVAGEGTFDYGRSPELGALGLPAVPMDAARMFQGDHKLGLGASAALVVARLAHHHALAGADLRSQALRRELLAQGMDAHQRAQQGGSGIDVAASVYGGALSFRRGAPAPHTQALTMPLGLHLSVFFLGTSQRTAQLRGLVAKAKERDAAAYAAIIARLADAADLVHHGFEAADVSKSIAGFAQTGAALASLGSLADAPIVPSACAQLADLASQESAAFLPAGAGGGDVAVFLGPRAPSQAFVSRAQSFALSPVALGLDAQGVRVLPEEPPS